MANDLKLWRGGVEPAESSPSGNEIKSWRGAVEPAAIAGGATVSLDGAALGTATAAGAVSATRALTGAALGEATGAGALTAARGLAGALFAQALLEGTFVAARALTGALTGTADASGALTVTAATCFEWVRDPDFSLGCTSAGDGWDCNSGASIVNGEAILVGSDSPTPFINTSLWDGVSEFPPAGDLTVYFTVREITSGSGVRVRTTGNQLKGQFTAGDHSITFTATGGGDTFQFEALAGFGDWGISNVRTCLTEPLSGAATGVALAAGTLGLRRPFAGAAFAQASAAGTLTARRGLAGALFAEALAEGALVATRALTGAALAEALAEGALTVAGQVALDGAILATATATGNLTVITPSVLTATEPTLISRTAARSVTSRTVRRTLDRH